MQIREITWSEKTIKILRECYDKAIKEKKDKFDCRGAEFLTSYAGFLLEFYEPKFLNKKH